MPNHCCPNYQKVNCNCCDIPGGALPFYVDRFDYDSDQRFKYTVVKTGYTTRTYDNVHIDRVIITTYTITADKTVTTNINVPYGVLYDCTGCTLTFAGAFEAGYYQIFTGTGTVTGLSEAVLEWWGGAGDDSTDNTAAYLSAVASLGGGNTTSVSNAGVLYIGKGIYRFSSALPITNIANVIVQGAGATYMNGFKVPATSIRYTGTAATFMSFIGNYCRGWTFRDLAIEYSSSSFTGTLVDIQTPGIDFDNVSFGGIGYTGSMTDTFTAQYLVKLATFECIIFNKCQFQKAGS